GWSRLAGRIIEDSSVCIYQPIGIQVSDLLQAIGLRVFVFLPVTRSEHVIIGIECSRSEKFQVGAAEIEGIQLPFDVPFEYKFIINARVGTESDFHNVREQEAAIATGISGETHPAAIGRVDVNLRSRIKREITSDVAFAFGDSGIPNSETPTV